MIKLRGDHMFLEDIEGLSTNHMELTFVCGGTRVAIPRRDFARMFAILIAEAELVGKLTFNKEELNKVYEAILLEKIENK